MIFLWRKLYTRRGFIHVHFPELILRARIGRIEHADDDDAPFPAPTLQSHGCPGQRLAGRWVRPEFFYRRLPVGRAHGAAQPPSCAEVRGVYAASSSSWV